MKLKKVISLCHQRKTFRLFDKISECGEIVQRNGLCPTMIFQLYTAERN